MTANHPRSLTPGFASAILLLSMSAATTRASNPATILSFDEFQLPAGVYSGIPNGYGGLNWNNFDAFNPATLSPDYGYRLGVVSGNNVAFNIAAHNPSITSSQSFNLISGNFIAALNLTPSYVLPIEVQGFAGNVLKYDITFSVNNAGPTLENFNFVNVTQVLFIPSQSPIQGFFAMDNLTVAVPEPDTLTILLLGAATGASGMVKRKSSSVSFVLRRTGEPPNPVRPASPP